MARRRSSGIARCQRLARNALRSACACRLGCTSQSMMRSLAFGGGFSCSSSGAVDDVAHAILLRIVRVYAASVSRGKVSSGLSAHMRDTSWPADAAGSDRRRRIASADNRMRTGTSCLRPIMSMMSATPAASGGESNGCVVTRMWSRMIAPAPVDPRHLDAHPAPGLVGAPHEGRQPTDAGFHQHHLQPGKFQEHAFVDQTQHLGLERLRLGEVIFVAIGRPADRARRAPILAAGMNSDRQFVFLGGLIHRPVVPPPQQRFALRQHQHGDERLSSARRSISSTAKSGACIGTTIDARRRESRASHSAAIQSLIALQKAEAI